jgi:hypothetical protein
MTTAQSLLPGLAGAPLLAFGVRALLSDVDPEGDIDLLEVELEEGIRGHGLNHPANLAAGHDFHDERPRGVVGHFVGTGADAKLVIVGTRKRVDDATSVPTEVPSLG